MPKTVTQPTTLAEFAADPADLLDRLTEPGRAVRLTASGEAVVVMSEETYRQMAKDADRGGLEESFDDVAAGRVTPALEALDRLAAEYGLKPVG